jgi:hypothetical protein
MHDVSQLDPSAHMNWQSPPEQLRSHEASVAQFI